MPFTFEDDIQQQQPGSFVFEDEPIDPREAEIAAHEAAGGGILPALERGLRRAGQSIAATVGSLPTTPLGPLPLTFLREPAREQVVTQEKAIQAIPQHPTLTRMAQAAGGEEGIFDAIQAAGGEFIESPDKLGFVAETLAEQVPIFAEFIAGTKGAGGLLKGTETLAKQAAALGAGGAFSSVAATYGPNVAEGLQKGLEWDDAESRALKQSAAQAVIDGATSAILPFKIGPNQYVNVPAQALIQASGGGGGEIARSAAVGEEAEMGDVVIEGMLELLGLPVEAVQAAALRPSKPDVAPVTPEPAPTVEPGFVFEDEFAEQVAEQGIQRQAEIDATIPPEARETDRRAFQEPVEEQRRVAERRAFQTPTEVAAAEFETRAGELELTDIQKEALAPVVDADPVTGFHPAKDRVPTLERAQAHVTETGEPAVYIETDIANLGGLNAELGHSGADKVFRGITDIFQTELDALPADSVKIRHGGDEFSAIVVNTDQQSVNEAMDRARVKVDEYIAQQGLTDLPHTKAGSPPGVGIKYGTSEIVPGLTSEEIFSEADLQVELQKKQEKTDVTPEKIEEVRAGPPERPAGRVAERVAEPVAPVAAEEKAAPSVAPKAEDQRTRVTPDRKRGEPSTAIPDDLEVTMDVETIETGTTVEEKFNAKELMGSIDDSIDKYTKLKKCLG